jgi:hypothetical protein
MCAPRDRRSIGHSAQYHDQKIAIVVIKDGVVKRVYRDKSFPRLCVWNGSQVPRQTKFHYFQKATGSISAMSQIGGENWLETNRDERIPNVYEQVMIQSSGFAMVMLWVDVVDDEYDPDENRTSKQRLTDRDGRWGR